MKGIVLAGGSGTRLFPLTLVASKQLMPVYDKPMIYYPLSTLMLMGIKDILIISTPVDTPRFKELLGDGLQFGVNFSYAIQSNPKGIAEAFLIGESFIQDDNVALILGDNFFYGQGFTKRLAQIIKKNSGATIFAYNVKNPKNYGIVNFNKKNKIIKIEEKPKNPKSNYAITGLYFFDKKVVKMAKSINNINNKLIN